MSLPQLIFYAFAGLTVLSALMVLLTRRVLYAAFWLIVAFLGIAALYVFAGADFIAITQLLIYVGGILILIIFSVMITSKIAGQPILTQSHNRLPGVLLGLAIFGMLLYGILNAQLGSLAWVRQSTASGKVVQESTIELLGVKLMSDYLLPFEVSAVLLLIALIGAAYIAQRPIK